MEQLKPVGRISTSRRLPLLLVTEGVGDIEFLKQISRTLHVADDRLPDLGSLEQDGELIFIPIGGREIAAWGERLSRLSSRRFSSTIAKRAPNLPDADQRPRPSIDQAA